MSVIVGYDLALPTPQTYAGIQVTIKNWLNRSDLTALIPDFIFLAEEKISRALRVRQMEIALDATDIATDGTILLASNIVGIKTLWAVGYESTPLHSHTFEYVKATNTSGRPTHFAWQGSTLAFNGSGSAQGVLYQHLPVLSETNTTNWVLTEAPSLYLYGSLAEAFDYVRDDGERDRWAAKFERVIDEMSRVDQRDKFGGLISIDSAMVV